MTTGKYLRPKFHVLEERILATVPAIICFGQSKHLNGWMAQSPAGSLPPSIFTSSRFPALYRGTQRAFERFLSSRGRLIRAVPDDPFAALRGHYLQQLHELRGFAVSTAAQHDSTLRDFLGRAVLPNRTLRTLGATDVENYIRLKSREVTRQALQHVIAHLRAFLRYCEDRGDITPGLHCIDTPRTYRAELPPRALDWKLVPKLVNSVDRHSRTGWRDHTVLHLMAYYVTARESRRPIEALDLSDLNADHVKRFLKFLESERGDSIATRNARLAAIHAFARFVIAEHPEHLAPFQQVLGIPFKRGAREAPPDRISGNG